MLSNSLLLTFKLPSLVFRRLEPDLESLDLFLVPIALLLEPIDPLLQFGVGCCQGIVFGLFCCQFYGALFEFEVHCFKFRAACLQADFQVLTPGL